MLAIFAGVTADMAGDVVYAAAAEAEELDADDELTVVTPENGAMTKLFMWGHYDFVKQGALCSTLSQIRFCFFSVLSHIQTKGKKCVFQGS